MVKRVEVKQGDISFVTGHVRTKRGYLNSLMRAMKMYKKEHDLMSVVCMVIGHGAKVMHMSKQKQH